jgi:hypothetical protein
MALDQRTTVEKPNLDSITKRLDYNPLAIVYTLATCLILPNPTSAELIQVPISPSRVLNLKP